MKPVVSSERVSDSELAAHLPPNHGNVVMVRVMRFKKDDGASLNQANRKTMRLPRILLPHYAAYSAEKIGHFVGRHPCCRQALE